MASSVPHLALSHGQVLWCLAGGKEPVPPLPDQVRYLRQLGIPFDESEMGQGRGVRLSYGFSHLIELGIAHEGLRRRIQTRFLKMLADERTGYRRLYREAYRELAPHPHLFEGNPRSIPIFDDEFFLRLHDRYSDAPGKITVAAVGPGRSPGDLVETYEGEEDRDVIALKALMVRLLSLAKIAPVTRPGPKG
jgi:hypothetical protein